MRAPAGSAARLIVVLARRVAVLSLGLWLLVWPAPLLAAGRMPTPEHPVVDGADVLSPDTEAALILALKAHSGRGNPHIAVVTERDAQGEGVERLSVRYAKGFREAGAANPVVLVLSVRERRMHVESRIKDYNHEYYMNARLEEELQDQRFDPACLRTAHHLIISTTPYGNIPPTESGVYDDPNVWLRAASAVLLWIAWFFVSCGVGYWVGRAWRRRPRRPWDDPQGPIIARLSVGAGVGVVPLLFGLSAHLFLAAPVGVFVGWGEGRVVRRALLIAFACFVVGTVLCVFMPALLVIGGSVILVAALVRYTWKRRTFTAPSTSVTYTPPAPESDSAVD